MMKYNEVVGLVNKILAEYSEATVRQIYYRMVSPPYQYMENTRSMYTSFDGMLTKARESGDIDWRKIIDNSRQVLSPERTYDSIDDFLTELKFNVDNWWQRYNTDLWQNQDCLVKVFVEKDALSRIFSEVALPYQVPVISGRGYNSFTQLMGQAEKWQDIDKTIYILYFGDFDPSGLDIDRSAYARLSKYCQADIKLIRIALTENDIANLPPNPTKALDKRAAAYTARYGDNCWELDALPPDQLRDRGRTAIERYIDTEKWNTDSQKLQSEKADVKERIAKLWHQ